LKLTDFERVGERTLIASKTYLQLAYGIKEILKAILEWDPTPQTAILDSVSQLTQKIQTWDDLWLAYAIASIEIQVQTLQGVSNVTLLMRKSEEIGIDLDHSSWTLLQKSVDEAVGRLIPHWTEPGLPVHSPAEQALYLGDLLFLRAIYERHCEKREKERPR